MPDKYRCTECLKQVTATKNQRYRSHTDGEGNPCKNSSVEIPPVELQAGPVDPGADPGVPEYGRDYATCEDCSRSVQLTRLGYFEHHTKTLRGDVRCAGGGTRFRPEETVKVDPELLGDPEAKTYPPGKRDSEIAPISGTAEELYARSDPTTSNGSTEPKAIESAKPKAEPSKYLQPPEVPECQTSSSPESTSTSNHSSKPEAEKVSTTSLWGTTSGSFRQPGTPYLQPPDYVKAEKKEMSEKSREIATRLREIFYSYSNRNTSDNRSAQKTLGPSEIGTPCDRRLAMSLMGIEPSNPGGDGWAAFVGTCTHDGLDKMFQWASANTGRFVTEMRLQFPSEFVPKGTADLLDRVFMVLIDHKIMGEYSLKKLREQGPPDHYRIQAHTYALGAVLAGEKVKDVAIVGWPRAGSSLDQMFVWTEPFDRKLAEEAIRRVENIARQANRYRDEPRPNGLPQYSKLEVAATFPVGDDCRFCPFFLKGDKSMERGCPGK